MSLGGAYLQIGCKAIENIVKGEISLGRLYLASKHQVLLESHY